MDVATPYHTNTAIVSEKMFIILLITLGLYSYTSKNFSIDRTLTAKEPAAPDTESSTPRAANLGRRGRRRRRVAV